MSVQSFRLLFNDGEPSPFMKPGKDVGAVRAAIANMIAESRGRFAHAVQFRMADGSTVVAKAKAVQP